ncbi:MAG: hypothetical protein AB1393_02300 [Candidatus Edwardsbacteria bacterium]
MKYCKFCRRKILPSSKRQVYCSTCIGREKKTIPEELEKETA